MTAKLEITSPLLTQPDALIEAFKTIVAETVRDMEADIKEQMRAPKSGRIYTRNNGQRAARVKNGLGVREHKTAAHGFRRAAPGQRFHRASAPGESPAIDRGTLINSLHITGEGLHARIEGSEILRLLDEGTRHIAPRPFVRPAIERARPMLEKRIGEAIARLING